jgi:trimethylamine-N-oxide reductase cytochrome c-type subunit TorC
MFKKILVTLVCAAPLVAGAETLYTKTPVEINAKETSSLLGKLSILTPVDVIETKGDRTKVTVKGWALKEYPSQIFKDAGLRVEYGSFDEEESVKLEEKGGKEVAGNEWVPASVTGWVPSAALTPDRAALLAEGKQKEAQTCSACHPAPEANHFTANQWASLLPVKGGRTGHTQAGGNAILFKYLQENAKPL